MCLSVIIKVKIIIRVNTVSNNGAQGGEGEDDYFNNCSIIIIIIMLTPAMYIYI